MSSLPGPFSASRILTLTASLAVALGAGTNYVYSAYAPQLGERLNINHTKLNLIALAGNVGVYSSGPIWGRVVDVRGPKIPMICACILLFTGYSGLRHIYDTGLTAGQTTISDLTFACMIAFGYMTGAGGNAGLSGAVNAAAKNFPDKLRASATGIVISGFGLSAFLFSTIAHFIFPGNTSSFLLVLSLGTALPMISGFFLARYIPIHHPPGEPAEIEAPTMQRDGSRTPLLREQPPEVVVSHVQELTTPAVHFIPGSIDGVELSPTRATKRHHRSSSAGTGRGSFSHPSKVLLHDGPLPNIYGRALWCTFEFWLLFVILSLLSGTGLMYINNVGSMSQALYARSTDVYSPIEASTWQSAQVSAISVTNCLGRIFIGLVSDVSKHHFQLPRSYMLILVSSIVLLSQVVAANIDSIQHLWMASTLLGMGHGSIFGIYPTICIEWFGMPHFSENWGYISLAPMFGGNLFSLAFGRNLDSHAVSVVNGQCMEGKGCYVDTLYLTIGGCFIAVMLSVYASWRDRKRYHVEVWESDDESEEEDD